MCFSKIFSAILVAGIISLSACTEGNPTQAAKLLTNNNSAVTESPDGPKRITDPKELSSLVNFLKDSRAKGIKEGATIQGVSGATGGFSGISTTGRVLNFSGSVSGVDASDMNLAGLRAIVEFVDVYGNTIAIWEYSAAYSNNGGFSDMTESERMSGTCSRTAAQLSIPANVTTIYMSLYVWDRTQPSVFQKLLQWQSVTP